MEEYVVYILYSEKLDKYYIGYTKELLDRLRRHNCSRKGFSLLGIPWVVVYWELYKDKGEAKKREIQLKRWKNRHRLEELIRRGLSE